MINAIVRTQNAMFIQIEISLQQYPKQLKTIILLAIYIGFLRYLPLF